MAGLRMDRMPFSLDSEPFPTIVENEPPVLVPLKPLGRLRPETSVGGKRRGARGRRADFTIEIGDSIPAPLSPTSGQDEGPSTFSLQMVSSQNSGPPTESQSQVSPPRVTPPPQRPGKPSLIRDKSGNGKSMSSLWGERPKAAVDRAMRFFGMKSGSDQSLLLVQESASELFEFCLTICMATSPEIMKFMMAFGSEEKKALQRLMGLARKLGLLGNETRSWDFPAPVTELATAFLEEAFAATRKQKEEKKANKSGSSMSLSAFARRGLKQARNSRVGNKFGTSSQNVGTRSNITLEGTGTMNRSTSNVGAVLGLQNSSTDLGGILNLRRSASCVSDMSSTSFTDFNNKRRLGQNGEPELRPSFLDFLYSLGAEEAAVGNKVMRQAPGVEGVPISMDINLPIRAEGKLDTVSEAGISYHSAYDAVYASEGESREVVQAEVININGVDGGQSTVRIAFRSKCLRTQNEWQRRLLTQQKVLLNMVSNKLKLAEQTVKAGDELRDEQKELLRGFRKIVVREANEADHDVIVYVVERNEELRHEVGELCKILEFPFQACEDLETARQLIARDVALPPITSRDSRVSSEWTVAADHTLDRTPTHSSHGISLLEGRPGNDMRDWRSRALTPKREPSKTVAATGSRRRSKESTEAPVVPADASRTRLVLLGATFLEEDLPREWQDDGIFVVLTSETEEFEEVGKILMASGEGEIRENLRRKGIGQYLLHPLSLEGLRGTVNEAFRKRFAHEYLLLQGVGRGTSGIVHRAKRLPDGGHFALKEINVKRLTRLAKAEVEREQKLLKEMSWPTVIFLVDTWENTVDRLRYIAMPLLDGGSLQTYIEKKEVDKFEKETLETVAEWYAQTVHGLTYLHWRGIIHRDIKPGNLLLGADQRSLQIGDLGSAALLPGNGPHPVRRNTFRAPVCTPMYAAPEVLLEECYSGASDIWAVGTSFFEVLTWQNFFPPNYGFEAISQEARQYDYNKGPWRRALMELKSSLPPVAEIPEMVRGDFLLRPTAAELVIRTSTLQRLRTSLGATGALPSSELRKAHFEELAQICTESAQATALMMQTTTTTATTAASKPPPTASTPQLN